MWDNRTAPSTGDNGGHLMSFDGTSFGSSNYPLRGGKLTLWEGGVRVPAFITGPGITGNNHPSIWTSIPLTCLLFKFFSNPPSFLAILACSASFERAIRTSNNLLMIISYSTGGREYSGLFHITDWFSTLTTMSKHSFSDLHQLDSFDQSG